MDGNETAGSLLAKLMQAKLDDATTEEVQALEQQLGKQTHRQLQGPGINATVIIGGRVIDGPVD
jgi:hypothetical protein